MIAYIEMEPDCRNQEGMAEIVPDEQDPGPIIVPPKKRSDKQIEALRLAQAARKAKAETRRAEKERPTVPPTPPPTPEPVSLVSVVSVVPEKKSKDYRAICKEQKRELELLRFERAVAERVQESQKMKEAAREPVREEPKVEPVQPQRGWTTTNSIIKKNVGPSW